MKRKIAAILAALSIFTAVPAFSEQISDFAFEDEWATFFTYDDSYYIFKKTEDGFEEDYLGIFAQYAKDGNRYTLTVSIEQEDDSSEYCAAEIGNGYYLIYDYANDTVPQNYMIAVDTKINDEWILYDNPSVSTTLLTDHQMITNKNAGEYAIHGSNFYLIKDNQYEKAPITILSNDAFQLTFSSANSNYKLLYWMIRSSFLE